MIETASPNSPRDQTRRTLLGLILQSGGTTRADLVKATGFSRSTVGHSVNQLIGSGVVEEAEQTEKGPGSGRGRPGLVLRPVAASSHVAAIDIGHTHVSVAVADSLGRELGRARHDATLDPSPKLDMSIALLDSLRRELAIDRIEQIVLGVPKPLNRLTGRVHAPKVNDGWAGMSPSEEIERRSGIRTHAENDAVLGAAGEHARGAAQGLDDFLYVKVSHGIGASIFLGGSPYRGSNGIVGTIGHCRLDGHTELCRCGRRGCLEAVCAIPAIESQLSSTHPGMSAPLVLKAMDETTEHVLTGAGRALGRVLADFCNLLSPQAIVLGGSLGSGYPAFVDGVAWAVREFAGSAVVNTTEVRAASLGQDAEVTGGLVLAAQELSERFVSAGATA